MDKKQKTRVVIIIPLMAALLVLITVIYSVLQAGAATPAVSSELADTGNAASPVTGEAAPAETQPAYPAHEAAAAPSCAFDFLIGQTAEQALEQIRPLDRPYRVLAPDSMATMDFSAERINLMTDENGVITSVHCG